MGEWRKKRVLRGGVEEERRRLKKDLEFVGVRCVQDC